MSEQDDTIKETYEYANFTARVIFDNTADFCPGSYGQADACNFAFCPVIA